MQADENLRVLIISSSGGSGHLMAAICKRYEIQKAVNTKVEDLETEAEFYHDLRETFAKDPSRKGKVLEQSLSKIIEQNEHTKELILDVQDNIFQYDVLKNWVPLGKRAVEYNNAIARNGDIDAQRFLMNLQGLADTIYAPFIVVNLIRALLATKASLVVDTQVMGTKAIVRAVRFVNWVNRTKIAKGKRQIITIRKVMTDLPTQYAMHFYNGLRQLDANDRKLITIESLPPIISPPAHLDESRLSDRQIEHYRNSFWSIQLGDISGFSFQYCQAPIRPAFLEKMDIIKKEGTLTIGVNTVDELKTLESIAGFSHTEEIIGELPGSLSQQKGAFNIASIILGSTGGIAMKSYIDCFARKAQESQSKKENTFCFIFCGRHEQGRVDFYNDIKEHINKLSSNHITMIPLGFQDDHQTASILALSDTIIARSGGILAMELLQILESNTECYLHSAQNSPRPSNVSNSNHLLMGMVDWEKGNALYLMEKKPVRLISVNTAASQSFQFLKECLPLQQVKEEMDEELNGYIECANPSNLYSPYLDYMIGSHSRELNRSNNFSNREGHDLFEQLVLDEDHDDDRLLFELKQSQTNVI